jgi:hypothetical protein
MKGDFSRSSYDEKKNYSGVLKQQGRVSLDADWNEQTDIIGHERETRTEDVIGHCGAPDEGGGFDIDVFDKKDLSISDGRLYAGGQLCEPRLHAKVPVIDFPAHNKVKLAAPSADGREFEPDEWVFVYVGPNTPAEAVKIQKCEEGGTLLTLKKQIYSGDKPAFGYLQRVLLYGKQVDYPDAPEATEGQGLVYLDVWKRHVTAIEDPEIRENALGGPDTATRVQTVSQVKLFSLASGKGMPGKLKIPKGGGPVEPAPQAGKEYTCCEAWDKFQKTAVENLTSKGRLKTYARDVPQTDLCHFAAAGGYTGLENRLYRVEIHEPGSLGAAKFKWSRDNGSVVFPIDEFYADAPKKVRLGGVRKDQVARLQPGDWVEVSNDKIELGGKAGLLVKIARAFDEATGTVELEKDVAGYAAGAHPRLRRWDCGTTEPDNYPITVDLGPMELEDGVMIKFSGEGFQVGNYWLFTARAVEGSVEELHFELPQGIEHHYCPLALVTWNGTVFSEVSDCRNLFAPLTAMTSFFMAGGGGQEAGPGDIFPEPLRVVVARGSHPVKGAKVEFKVDGISGRLWDNVAAAWTTDRCVVTTNGQGVAQILAGTKCSPDCPPGPIRVTATLKEAPGCTCIGEHAPLCFGLYLANPVIFYGGGDGQSGPAGKELPSRLRIIVAPRAQPDASTMPPEVIPLPPVGPRHIRFKLAEEGNGSLRTDDGNSGQQVDVAVSAAGGVARCFWTLGTDQNKQQRVEAWLMTDEPGTEPLRFPIVFNARICSGVLERCPKFLDELRSDGMVRNAEGELGFKVTWSADNLKLSHSGGVAYVRGCRFEVDPGLVTPDANESATHQAILVDAEGAVRLVYKDPLPEKYALIAFVSTFQGRITQAVDARRDLYHLDEKVQRNRELIAANHPDRRQFVPLLAQTLPNLRLRDGRNRVFSIGNKVLAFGLAFDQESMWATNFRRHAVARIPRDARAPNEVKFVEVDGLTTYAAFDGNRHVWFTSPYRIEKKVSVANNKVFRVDVTGGGVGTVEVGSPPLGSACDGDFMWVGNVESRSLSVINLETLEVVRTIELDVCPICLAFDGKYMWVAGRDPVDSQGKPFQVKEEITMRAEMHKQAAFKRYAKPFATDARQEKTVKAIPNVKAETLVAGLGRLYRIEKPWGNPELVRPDLPARPLGMAFDGSHVWLTMVGGAVRKVDVNSKVLGELPEGFPPGIAPVFDGSHLWLLAGPAAHKVDVATNRHLGTVVLAAPAWQGAFDGTHVWCSWPNKIQRLLVG